MVELLNTSGELGELITISAGSMSHFGKGLCCGLLNHVEFIKNGLVGGTIAGSACSLLYTALVVNECAVHDLFKTIISLFGCWEVVELT